MPTSTSLWWLWTIGVTAFLIVGSVVAALVHRRRASTKAESGDSRSETKDDPVAVDT